MSSIAIQNKIIKNYHKSATKSTTYHRRGTIFDRNNQILALDIASFDLYVSPWKMIDIEKTIDDIINLIPQLSPRRAKMIHKIQNNLNNRNQNILIIKSILPETKKQFYTNGVTGVHFEPSVKRFYPFNNATCHILGQTSIDNLGIEGIEFSLNTKLSKNQNVHTTLDIEKQVIIRDELINLVKTFNAEGALASLVDISSGEILASVSLPDFNPNDKKNQILDEKFNKNISGIYEYGSIMKIFTYAFLLENNIKINKKYKRNIPIVIDKFTIKEPGNSAVLQDLTLQDAFIRSSNIILIRSLLETDYLKYLNFLKNFNICNQIKTSAILTAMPMCSKKPSKTQSISNAIGYSLATTPLNVLSSITNFFTDPEECNKNLHIIKNNNVDNEYCEKSNIYISKKTKNQIKTDLAKVAQNSTKIKHIGLKTGTAIKQAVKNYDPNNVIFSVLAITPVDKINENPKYALIVSLDKPNKDDLSKNNRLYASKIVPYVVSMIEKLEI